MKAIYVLQRSCCALLLLLAMSFAGWAQSPQVFVSAQTGVDGGGCGVLNPCRTITHALTQVADGGKIVLTDSGDYDQVTINKAVMVMAAPGALPLISVGQSGSSNILIAAASTVNVTLNGLLLDGRGLTANGVRGGNVNLVIENCSFDNFSGAAVFINDAGTLQMADSSVRYSGQGVVLQPTGSGKTVSATIVQSQFAHLGLRGVDVRTSVANTLRAVVRDCAFTGSGTAEGIVVFTSGGGTAQVAVDGVSVAKFNAGFNVNGAGSTMRVTRSLSTRNAAGLQSSNSGALLSRGNNTIEGNTTNGNFTGTFTAK